jgi:hypothetical protein
MYTSIRNNTRGDEVRMVRIIIVVFVVTNDD